VNRTVSSADPAQLMRYSEVADALDGDLMAAARRLQVRLENFEARCAEPGFCLQTSGWATDLQQYAERRREDNGWVRQIGLRFKAADARWGRSALSRSGGWISRIGDSFQSLAAAIVYKVLNYANLIAAPGWLQEQAFSLSWTANAAGLQASVVSEVVSTESLMQDLHSMSLAERWQWLERVQMDIEEHLQSLTELEKRGAGEHFSASDLEQRIVSLQRRQEELQSHADNWLNRVWISDRGLESGSDDGTIRAPWRTRSDDLEVQITEITDQLAELEVLLAHQREYERVAVQLQVAKNAQEGIEAFLQEHWWNDVPFISQRGLNYGTARTTNWACVPAATAMVLEYWHGQDPANEVLSAQELLDINVRQGEFTEGAGMSPTRIHDEVGIGEDGLGYTFVEDKMGASFEELQNAVIQGPVIVTVKLNMRETGVNHVVVVTGISPNGQQVRVNDPWAGTHTCTREEFTRSWGTNFGPNTSSNNFTIIRP